MNDHGNIVHWEYLLHAAMLHYLPRLRRLAWEFSWNPSFLLFDGLALLRTLEHVSITCKLSDGNVLYLTPLASLPALAALEVSSRLDCQGDECLAFPSTKLTRLHVHTDDIPFLTAWSMLPSLCDLRLCFLDPSLDSGSSLDLSYCAASLTSLYFCLLDAVFFELPARLPALQTLLTDTPVDFLPLALPSLHTLTIQPACLHAWPSRFSSLTSLTLDLEDGATYTRQDMRDLAALRDALPPRCALTVP